MTDSEKETRPRDAAAAGTENAESEARETPAPPFSLKGGTRVQYGHRTGKVEVVRGGGPLPYEVRIGWDGQKYPEWFQYGTLRILYNNGKFKLL